MAQRKSSLRLAAFRADPPLFLLLLGSATTSIVALLLELADIIRMPYTLSFVTAPGMVILLCVAVLAGRAGRAQLVRRLRVGFFAGLIGLVVYNGTRWIVSALLSVSTTPFYSIYVFGNLITGAPADSMTATLAGWLYHISNGVTFAIIYTLIAGPARWWYGLIWGAILELAMLAIYPASTLLRPPALAPFIVISVTSHALFGASVGLTSQHFALGRADGPR